MGVKGIDVSSYHGKIDWDKVKDEVDFVLIRAGWGKECTDLCFRKNIEGAVKANMKIGVYWYIYAKNERELLLNAKKFNELIYPYSSVIKMGVWGVWDVDSDKYKPNTTNPERTKLIKLFCETMSSYGYITGYYADVAYYKTKLTRTNLGEYPLWLCNHATSNDVGNPLIWQYDARGRINGIVSRVNLNLCYEDIKEFSPSNKKYPTLEKGSIHLKVRLLQSLLAEKGYAVSMTGVFDPLTYEAVCKLQKDNGLTPDGVVGPLTWKILTK